MCDLKYTSHQFIGGGGEGDSNSRKLYTILLSVGFFFPQAEVK